MLQRGLSIETAASDRNCRGPALQATASWQEPPDCSIQIGVPWFFIHVVQQRTATLRLMLALQWSANEVALAGEAKESDAPTEITAAAIAKEIFDLFDMISS